MNAIALPPAYTDAWFCPDPDGHIQATGKDARGRKQYRYHADYRAKQDASKYEGTREFGAALPKLRRRVEEDLKRRKLGRDTVLAAVVRLLDQELIRVGNEEYARDNASFGATTLRGRHVRSSGGKMRMRFKGKHGIVHEATITDASLKRIVKQCQDLPGQMLFQYINGDGEPQAIDFRRRQRLHPRRHRRRFHRQAFPHLGRQRHRLRSIAVKAGEARVSLKTVIEPVAEALGNTAAMSRKSYVHPALIDALKDRPRDPLRGMKRPRARKRLTSAEVGLLKFLARKADGKKTGLNLDLARHRPDTSHRAATATT